MTEGWDDGWHAGHIAFPASLDMMMVNQPTYRVVVAASSPFLTGTLQQQIDTLRHDLKTLRHDQDILKEAIELLEANFQLQLSRLGVFRARGDICRNPVS